MKVELRGADQVIKRLDGVLINLKPAARGALNSTAARARNRLYISPLRRSIRAGRLRRAFKLKRANARYMNARIIPSSSGIPVLDYASWGFDRIDATRGRIWVAGPNGRKVAAGFVNPSSEGKKPLATRSQKARTSRQALPGISNYTYRWRLTGALGLSAAYWFKQLTTSSQIDWVNDDLAAEFERRLSKIARV